MHSLRPLPKRFWGAFMKDLSNRPKVGQGSPQNPSREKDRVNADSVQKPTFIDLPLVFYSQRRRRRAGNTVLDESCRSMGADRNQRAAYFGNNFSCWCMLFKRNSVG